MVALTGGKTGGHIVPLIAISKEIDDVIYVGGKGYLEEKICKSNNINFIGLDIKHNIFSILSAYKDIKIKNVDAIISTGGYVSIPLLLFGIIHKIPIFLLEENTIIGDSNRFFYWFAKKVFLSYPLKPNKRKYMIVGQPLLKYQLSYSKYSKYKCDILIIGGSLGSRPLCDCAKKLSGKYNVCLVSGRYYDEYKSNLYQSFPYVDDLLNLMLQAKLVISRAGAQTVAEIFYINKPVILVPSLKTKRNHQYLNALYFQDKNCCKVVSEKNLNELDKVIYSILNNEILINSMKDNQKKMINYDSSKIIANEIFKEIKK